MTKKRLEEIEEILISIKEEIKNEDDSILQEKRMKNLDCIIDGLQFEIIYFS